MGLFSPWTFAGLFILWCMRPYIVVYFFSRKSRKFAQDNGCEPAANASANNRLWWNWDIIYHDISLILSGKDILTESFVPRFKQWGNTFAFYSYGRPVMVLTCEPENIKTILATKFNDFGIEAARVPFKRVLGNSIFTTDGASWEHARAMFRPQFARELINDFESTEHASLALFEAIGETKAGVWTGVIDLMPMFYRFTLDTTSEFLFGDSVETQRIAMLAARGDTQMAAQAAAGKAFSDAIALAQDWILWRMRFGPNLFWICELPKYRRAMKTIHNYVGKYVDEALKIRASGAGKEQAAMKDGEKFSLLKIIAEQTQDKDDLRDQLMALLIAGRDTTSVLLSWLILCLALHPKEIAKLRRAILQDIGPETNSQVLDFAKLKGCRYLQYCLNETLRLFAPVPVNGRQVKNNTVLPVGGGPDGKSPIALVAGSGVAFSVHAMHIREDIWGADAVEFKPERWNGRKLDWSYLPFNGGPRVCLGQQYALIEASYLVVRLLQRFDMLEIGPSAKGNVVSGVGADGKWGIPKTFGLVQYPKDGVCVRLRRAS